MCVCTHPCVRACRFLPAPGEGPSLEQRVNGHWSHDLYATTEGPNPVTVHGKIGVRGGERQPLCPHCARAGLSCSCPCPLASILSPPSPVLLAGRGLGGERDLAHSTPHIGLHRPCCKGHSHLHALQLPPADPPPTRQDRRDPGYWSTSRMLLEAGLCLVLEAPRLAAEGLRQGGVLTPASACGNVLLERLRAAGFTFKVGGAGGRG